jgi:cytidylate kinase
MVKSHDLSHLDALVDRHMSLSEVRKRIKHEDSQADHGSEAGPGGPFITVSREYGSGGTALATRLSTELGWPLFNKEILEAIAESANTRMRVLKGMDEHLIGRFEEFINHLIVPESINQVAFIKEMSQVILTLGRRGNAVLLGRGANWLLARDAGVRIRTVAPMDRRIAEVARRKDIDRKEAERLIRESDHSTAVFVQKIFDQDVDDPLGYDLVLNLDHLSEHAAVSAVHSALHSLPFRQPAAVR